MIVIMSTSLERKFCKNGHAMTPDNTRPRIDRPGHVECWTCNRLGRERFRRLNPLYAIWQMMNFRCYNPKAKDWHLYGGREGNPVTVCDRWRYSYKTFVADMPPRPSLQHSIDRIDGTKGYEPGNVRWATATQQARNARTNHWIEFNGDRRTLAEWSQFAGLRYDTFFMRLKNGWSFEKALTTPLVPFGEQTEARKNRLRDSEGNYVKASAPA